MFYLLIISLYILNSVEKLTSGIDVISLIFVGIYNDQCSVHPRIFHQSDGSLIFMNVMNINDFHLYRHLSIYQTNKGH